MRCYTLLLCLAGVALHLYTALFQAEPGLARYLTGWFLWSCAPYAVALALLMLVRRAAIAMGYAAASLCLDASMFISVFVYSTNSTAAVGLIVVPFWNLVLFGPAGSLIGGLLFGAWLRRQNARRGFL